jgi:hypothetical protein
MVPQLLNNTLARTTFQSLITYDCFPEFTYFEQNSFRKNQHGFLMVPPLFSATTL